MNEKTNPVSSLKSAMKHYASVEKFIASVGNQMEEILGKENFQTEIFLRQFDFALQLILFKVIVADGDADSGELFAIKNIPQHGDVLDMLNEKVKEKMTWENLAESDIQNLVSFSSLLDTALDSVLDNFMEGVAFVDAHGETKEGLFLGIASAIDEISTDVAGVNGLIEGSERYRIFESVVAILRKKYDECVQLVIQKSKPGEA